MDSLSYEARVRSDAVWDDPSNSKMKAERKDRNVLMPGEILTIPDPEVKWEDNKHTGLTHIFKRTLPTKEFKFQVLMGMPLTGGKLTACRPKIEIDGKEVTGTLTNDWVTCQIPPNAKEAVITLYYTLGQKELAEVLKERKYTVKLGFLRPVTTPEGQGDRLTNLGFMAPLPNGATPTLSQALKLFQASYGIKPVNGIAGDDTVKKLKELTGDPD